MVEEVEEMVEDGRGGRGNWSRRSRRWSRMVEEVEGMVEGGQGGLGNGLVSKWRCEVLLWTSFRHILAISGGTRCKSRHTDAVMLDSGFDLPYSATITPNQGIPVVLG